MNDRMNFQPDVDSFFSHHEIGRRRDLYIQFLFAVLAFKMGSSVYHQKGIWCVLTFISKKLHIHMFADSQFNKCDVEGGKGLKSKLYTRNCKVNRNGEDCDGSYYYYLHVLDATWLCCVCDCMCCSYQTNGLCTCFVLTPEIFAHTNRQTHSHSLTHSENVR